MTDKGMALNQYADMESYLLHIHPEWKIDPGILLRLKDDDLRRIMRVQASHMAEMSKLAAKAMELRATMFIEIRDIVSKPV